MPSLLLRIALVVLVLGLLGRAGRVAWSRRDLARDVWRSIRVRHVVGGLGLLVAVVSVTVASATAVPVLGLGLGTLVRTEGNAVFAPVGLAAEVTGAGTTTGMDAGDVLFITVVTVFLALVVLLLPWFAFVEEEVFRAGAESWSLPVRVMAALVFGAAHLVMLVPFAAALGIAVAGFAYGELYRRGVRGRGLRAPHSVHRAFRPTRRSRAAVAVGTDAADDGPAMDGGLAAVRRQVDGLFTSTVWHTTFNTTVVTLVWATLVIDAL